MVISGPDVSSCHRGFVVMETGTVETGTIADLRIWEKDGTFCVMPQSLQARKIIDEMTDEGRAVYHVKGLWDISAEAATELVELADVMKIEYIDNSRRRILIGSAPISPL